MEEKKKKNRSQTGRQRKCHMLLFVFFSIMAAMRLVKILVNNIHTLPIFFFFYVIHVLHHCNKTLQPACVSSF